MALMLFDRAALPAVVDDLHAAVREDESLPTAAAVMAAIDLAACGQSVH
jgi:hypothetical protein